MSIDINTFNKSGNRESFTDDIVETNLPKGFYDKDDESSLFQS